MVFESVAQPYPVAALPTSLRDAVNEVTGFTQCPVAMVACSALSAISVAAQGLVNVRRGTDLEGPVSLFMLVIADSGERKSTCDEQFKKPLDEWQTEQREMLKDDLARYRADKAACKEECDAVKVRIKQAKIKQEPTDADKGDLFDLERNPPEPVRVPRIILENETAENLAWRLANDEGWPSAGLLFSEAGVVFGGHSMRNDSRMQSMARLNKLWSG